MTNTGLLTLKLNKRLSGFKLDKLRIQRSARVGRHLHCPHLKSRQNKCFLNTNQVRLVYIKENLNCPFY